MNIIIPKTFSIFSTTYKIKEVKKVDSENSMGECDIDKKVIKLQKSLSLQDKEVTFLHELTHTILLSLGYDDLSNDESFVEQFSAALHQALTTGK